MALKEHIFLRARLGLIRIQVIYLPTGKIFRGRKGDFHVDDTSDYSPAAPVGWGRWLLRIFEMGDGWRHRDLWVGPDNSGDLLPGRGTSTSLRSTNSAGQTTAHG